MASAHLALSRLPMLQSDHEAGDRAHPALGLLRGQALELLDDGFVTHGLAVEHDGVLAFLNMLLAPEEAVHIGGGHMQEGAQLPHVGRQRRHILCGLRMHMP